MGVAVCEEVPDDAQKCRRKRAKERAGADSWLSFETAVAAGYIPKERVAAAGYIPKERAAKFGAPSWGISDHHGPASRLFETPFF